LVFAFLLDGDRCRHVLVLVDGWCLVRVNGWHGVRVDDRLGVIRDRDDLWLLRRVGLGWLLGNDWLLDWLRLGVGWLCGLGVLSVTAEAVELAQGVLEVRDLGLGVIKGGDQFVAVDAFKRQDTEYLTVVSFE
jgi:hypothetical protein